MIITIISVILLIIGGFSKSVMDKLADGKWDFIYYGSTPHHRTSEWFDFKHNTWRNKYKNNDPKQGSKFPFSTTILVFLTDAWHFSQFIMYTCLISGVILFTKSFPDVFGHWVYNYITIFILVKSIFTGAFELFYAPKKILLTLKQPFKVLGGLICFAIIAGITYNYTDNTYILNTIENISLGIIAIGGITAIIGFIYGLININK